MINKPSTIRQYRGLVLKATPSAILALVERITQTAGKEWTRDTQQEDSLRKSDSSFVGYIFQCSPTEVHPAAVLSIIEGTVSETFEVFVHPPFDECGRMETRDYNSVATAFLAQFRSSIEELAECHLLEPEAVRIEDFVGQGAARAFDSFVAEHLRYGRSLSDSHLSDKWVDFVCRSFKSNSSGHLSANTLAQLLKLGGLSEDFSRELGFRWEDAAQILNRYDQLSAD